MGVEWKILGEEHFKGLEWFHDEIKQDGAVLELKSANINEQANGHISGTPGRRVVRVECLAVGSAQLRMARARVKTWKGFFPAVSDGLKVEDDSVTQHVINVNCTAPGADATDEL